MSSVRRILRVRALRDVALAAALAAGTLSPALAQSLRELYEAARGYDASYLASRALAASAEHRVAQSEALLKPSAALTAGATATQLEFDRLGSGRQTTLQGALSGRVPLLNDANRVSVEQARRSLEVAQADLQAAEQELILRVAQAYFDVLAAQDALATAQAGKTAIGEQLASARRNFEVGTATITDTREAQARFDLATAQELAAQNDLRTKRIALDQLVGRTDVQPLPLKVPVVLPAVQPADVQAWVEGSQRQHPLVRKAQVGLEVARLETDKARAGQRPTLEAVGQLGANRQTGSFATSPGSNGSASVGLQLNWPLWTGGAVQSRIQETLVLQDKAQQDLEAARRGVAQGTRVAYFGVQSGQAQVLALQAAEASSLLALQATQLGYKVGVRVNLDVLNAQTQLNQTQRDLARSRYEVLVGGLRLRQAAGQLSETDLHAVDALLGR